MKLKNKILIIIGILFLLALLISVFNLNSNSNLKKTQGVNIYYRVYNRKVGWSKWVKNGNECKLKNDEQIENIQIKLKSKKGSDMTYNVYNKKWINELTINDKLKNSSIKGIEIEIYKELAIEYSVCYTTHNEKDLWLGWACNGQTSGNKNETINSIKIKVVPKNVVLDEYLENYKSSAITSKNF